MAMCAPWEIGEDASPRALGQANKCRHLRARLATVAQLQRTYSLADECRHLYTHAAPLH